MLEGEGWASETRWDSTALGDTSVEMGQHLDGLRDPFATIFQRAWHHLGDNGSIDQECSFLSDKLEDVHGKVSPIVHWGDNTAAWSTFEHCIGQGSTVYITVLANLIGCFGNQVDYELSLPPLDRWSVREDNPVTWRLIRDMYIGSPGSLGWSVTIDWVYLQ